MKQLLLFTLLIPSIGFGQKLIVNETDKFNKSHKLKTSDVKLKYGLHAYMRSAGYPDTTYYFIILHGFGRGADVIGENEKAIFLLDDDTTITVYSTGFQSYEISKYDNRFNHQYQAVKSDIEALASKTVKSIRKYGSDHYNDFDLLKSNSDDLKKLATLILENQ